MTRLLLALAVLAASAVQATVVDITWNKENRFDYQTALAAGKFVELCANLPNGQEIQWQYEANAPLDFNIHYHVEKSVVYPAKLALTARSNGTLATTVAQDYCWMWLNESNATIELQTRMRR